MPKTGISIRSRAVTEEGDSVTVQSLVPGEGLAYKITHEVNYGNGEKMWVSFGSSTDVRAGETDQAASKRLVDYVHTQVGEAIHSAISHAETL